ncbi:type III PLP-dependent enzyme [Micromonospora sp. ZYX-F-536]|uniref:type III PLP-dependent enzyme n=1 Tax=Micromonospora sp. ZYX-F-536 TaxID=3457629 RepID=UPI0040406FE9
MTDATLAARFGTPLYVYDQAEIRAAHAALTAALPTPGRLYYSLKANPHPHVAATLAALGCHAEVSSSGELTAALEAGFEPERIMVTGPGKADGTLDIAMRHGVHRFSAESPTDLQRIGLAATRAGVVAQCLLRVNADRVVTGMGLSMTGRASQFGVDASWVAANPAEFRAAGTQVTGLHLYMGTNISHTDRLIEQFRTSVALAADLKGALDVSEIDLGGGFAAPYAHRGARPDYPDLADRLAELLDDHLSGWRSSAPLVSFEAGRFLVATSGTLFCTVLDVKPSKGRTFVVLDSGVHHLGGMSGLRRLPRVIPDLLTTDIRDVERDCVLVGPLCTPLDTWSDGVALPALRRGDLVAVPNVGAYGLTASLVAFLGHPAATEVVVDGDRLISASRLTLQRIAVA